MLPSCSSPLGGRYSATRCANRRRASSALRWFSSRIPRKNSASSSSAKPSALRASSSYRPTSRKTASYSALFTSSPLVNSETGHTTRPPVLIDIFGPRPVEAGGWYTHRRPPPEPLTCARLYSDCTYYQLALSYKVFRTPAVYAERARVGVGPSE